jgi:hypothetical protein
MPEVLAHHPMKKCIRQPGITFERRIQAFQFILIVSTRRDSLSNFRFGGCFVEQNIIVDILPGLKTEDASGVQ